VVNLLPATEPAPALLVADAAILAPMLSIGLRTLRTWDAAGKLPAPIRVSRKVLWPLEEIKRWLEAGAPDRKTWEAIKAARSK